MKRILNEYKMVDGYILFLLFDINIQTYIFTTCIRHQQLQFIDILLILSYEIGSLLYGRKRKKKMKFCSIQCMFDKQQQQHL